MAVKHYLPGGTTTDVVTLTLPTFFTRTPEELIEFNLARRPLPETGAPDMDKVGAFLAEHPETVPAVTAAISAPIPASYAQLTYHAIHAFTFVAADGTIRAARYHFVPAAGEASISDEEASACPDGYLRDELETRFGSAPAIFHVDLELAADDDPIDDPTAVWPEGRDVVRVGELSVDALAFDREIDGDILVFDPTRLTDGIEATDDKILAARSGAYRVSVTRRSAGSNAS
jgi:catalase